MKEFQVVIHKLQGRRVEDEESVTDLLNERVRSGWALDSITDLPDDRLLMVFSRET